MQRLVRGLGLLMLAATVTGCAFSTTTARDWNGLMGLDGKPTYYLRTTKVGMNLFIAVPFLGDMGISGLTRDMTEKVKADGGNDVRIVEGTSESYFYGWPPFTWIITPVISTVSAEYTPSEARYAEDQKNIATSFEKHGHFRWYMPWTW